MSATCADCLRVVQRHIDIGLAVNVHVCRSPPWNASPEDLRTWAQPPPADNPGQYTVTDVATSDRHFGQGMAFRMTSDTYC